MGKKKIKITRQENWVGAIPPGSKIAIDIAGKIELQNVLLDDLALVSQVVLIGQIDMETFNTAGLGDTDFLISYGGAKPEGYYLERLFFANVEEVVSDYGNRIAAIGNVAVETDINILNAKAQNKVETDINVNVTIENANVGDWISGKIDVYAKFVLYPANIV